MKSVLIIGMGKFGHHLCKDLIALDNDVMIIDQQEERVSDLISLVTNVQIGDCTNPQVIKNLGVGNFDIVFVCIGTNFQSSLEITSLVKEMGARYVISKANRDVHAKFLLRNGADEVIYPDRDIWKNLQDDAAQIMCLTTLNSATNIPSMRFRQQKNGSDIRSAISISVKNTV